MRRIEGSVHASNRSGDRDDTQPAWSRCCSGRCLAGRLRGEVVGAIVGPAGQDTQKRDKEREACGAKFVQHVFLPQ